MLYVKTALGSSWAVCTAPFTPSNQKPRIYTALIQQQSLRYTISDIVGQQTRECPFPLSPETIHQITACLQILVFNNAIDIFQCLEYALLHSYQTTQLCFTGLYQHFEKRLKIHDRGQPSQTCPSRKEFLFCLFSVLLSL